ncbi:MAG: RNA polymerase sigma factor [Candidatus Izemoplasmatales bacterium]
MNFRDHNDFEIISLIKQGSEEAFALMIAKYNFLIAKKIKKFNLVSEFDDCHQEALLVLYKSALRFDERYAKSFTRYFERNLENRLISVIRKRKSYGKFLATKSRILVEDTLNEAPGPIYSDKDIKNVFKELSAFEASVFKLRFQEDMTPSKIAANIGCPIKKVYNAIDRIRHKLKLHLP